MGALSTPTSLRQMQVMPGPRCFALIGTDEISKHLWWEYSLTLHAFASWIDSQTHFALIGDPCQTTVSSTSLENIQQYASNYGADHSTLDWLWQNIHKSDPDPAVLVAKVDLVNRYKRGARCREKQHG